MEKQTVLEILLQLEEYRIAVEKKEIKSTSDDFTIRSCQAQIAANFFNSRRDWTEILKNEYNLKY